MHYYDLYSYNCWILLVNIYSRYGFVIAGQSYEIRMLDNRKIGELPEITDKMVKVRSRHGHTHT